jgi:predicted extracellular nuclease
MPVQRSSALILALALALSAMVPLVAPVSARASSHHVWINEFHYDNASTDLGEAIEVAGVAGTDLTGWDIVLYNGSNGAVYDTDALSGTLANQQGGFGTAVINYPSNGIQNGGPDGIALVDAAGAVVQFLSYEGTFAAVGGAANGMTSTDIGVSQSGNEAAGLSLQLSGTGSAYADFTWSTPQTSTFGAVNTGQTFGDGGPGDPPTSDGGPVVISQVYGGGGNSGATYTHDFIELFNRTDEAVSLAGWSVQYANTTGTSWTPTPLTGSIAPGGYYLVQEAAGAGGSTALPPPDATGGIAMGASSGKVALVGPGTALSGSCPLDVTVDFVGYGSANCFEGSAAVPALSNTTAAIRDDGGAIDTDNNVGDFTTGAPNPRNSGGTTPTDPCVEPATPISAVQGAGMTSPLAGQTVTVQAVVVGDFQNNDQPDDGHLNGFYIQEEDAQSDGNGATSEGLFVFRGPDVSVGDQVRVTGQVIEFGSGSQLTELTNVDVLICASEVALPAVTPVTLPVTDPTDFERYEGMLVSFPQTLTISEFFNFDRFGEIVLTVDRDFQPTAIYEPGSTEAVALAEENRLNRITLDDGISTSNPEFTRHPNGEEFTLTNRFRGGDTVANVTGVMDDSFGLYKVQPTEGADYTAVNLRPVAPDHVGGSLTVASFNVLNYFTTLTSAGNVCGPLANQECRGADTAAELERQQTKIVAALAAMDADVVGLIEIENHSGDVPTGTLVDALNVEVGAGTYDYIETGGIGTDVIRVAFIYKPASVTPVGEFAVLDSSVDDRFNDDHNRPVLAQAFEENATGGVVTVAVNHLKSKGSGCGPGDDDPMQGSCNLTRAMAAEALVDWLAGDPTGSGDLDALIIGDLNSYDKEDPIDQVREGADNVLGTNDDFTDLVLEYAGEYAYSYLFDGQLGYLDHALSSATLTPQVTGATVWNINADEPDILDYDMSFKKDPQDALWEPNAYRSSDHDPVIVGLDLEAFGFGGLEPPIDDDNTARAGSTVVVKFSLDEQLDLEDVLFQSIQVFACGDWPLGASDDAVSTGATELRYDPTDDQYVFTWKTDAEWAGECKTLVVTLSDGTYVTADFEFRL